MCGTTVPGLCECCHIAEVREQKWDEVVGTMPDEMFAHIQTLNAVGKTDFALTGMNSKQVIPE